VLVLALTGCTWVSRASVSTGGVQGNGASGEVAISGDGRYVAFDSDASNLVPGDTNGLTDVFVRDTATGTTTRASLDSTGGYDPAISADGRYVAFLSSGVFVRDMVAGTTTRADVDGNGVPGDDDAPRYVAISANGRFVAFESSAELVPGDDGYQEDIFVRDLVAGTTTQASVSNSGGQGMGFSIRPSISADGRYVTFQTWGEDLAGESSGEFDVLVRDIVAGTTTLASVNNSGTPANSESFYPVISANGRYVAFSTGADNLVPGDTNGLWDVFVRDLATGTTARVSLDSNGGQSTGGDLPAISADGRYVAFLSSSGSGVFVRDTVAGTTSRMDLDNSGSQASNGDTSYKPAMSADGRYVAFQSAGSNLVPGDTNGAGDVFVRANPTVTVSGVAPASAPRGVTRAVTITGRGFRFGDVVNAGSDVTVTNVIVVNDTTITAKLTPAPGAAIGARNVVVAGPGSGPGWLAGSTGLCAGCLSVT